MVICLLQVVHAKDFFKRAVFDKLVVKGVAVLMPLHNNKLRFGYLYSLISKAFSTLSKLKRLALSSLN